MKSNSVLALAIIGLSLGLNACSGGGGSVTTGIQCPRSYNPTNMKVALGDKQRIELAALDTLPAGTYVEVSASLYYVDPMYAPNKNFRFEMRDSSTVDEKTKSRTYKAANYCVRNSPNLKNFGLSVGGVSKLVITPGAPADSEERAFSFGFDGEGKLSSDSKVQEKPASVGEVYKDATEVFIFKRSETEIEIRSSGVVETTAGQTGTYYLSVVLQKQP